MDSRPDWLSVDADETVVWQGAPRVRRILPTAAAATLWIALLVLAVTVGPRVAPVPARAFPGVVLAGAALLLAVPAVAAVAWAYLRTTNVEYVLTDRNCYRKSGVLSTRVSRIGLSTVERTSLSKDVWGNRFDYGTISISTAGSDGVDLRFTDLDDPEPVRAEMRRLIGTYRGHDADAGADAETTAPLDESTADALLADFRALRESAARVERGGSDR
jgi:uncharacterized membrane protein YdbT with pleckstrin-like domain